MAQAIRLDTDMSGWCPVTRHYLVGDGYVAVTRRRFVGTTPGVEVFDVNADGVAATLTPLFVGDDMTHTAALEQLGYTVVDEIGDDDLGSL